MNTEDKLLITIAETGNVPTLQQQLKLHKKLIQLMCLVRQRLDDRGGFKGYPLYWTVQIRTYGNVLMDIRVAIVRDMIATHLHRVATSQNSVEVEGGSAEVTIDTDTPHHPRKNFDKMVNELVTSLIASSVQHEHYGGFVD